jgi:SH3 domain-containing YSC84-like protein 1
MNFVHRATWQEDDAVSLCNVCKVEFDQLQNRKHHCRYCGLVVCAECSPHNQIIPEEELVWRPRPFWAHIVNVSTDDDDFREPQRTCNACEPKLRPKQAQLKAEVSRCNMETVVDSDSSSINLPQMNFYLENEIRNASMMVSRMASQAAEERVPKDLLEMSRGVAFLTIIKVGMGFSARYGTGLVISRLPDDTWSAPSAITISGIGWGFQIGGEVTDVMLVLSTDSAVETFKSRAQLNIGAELGLSAGPYGRSLESDLTAGNKGAAHAFSYAHSQGLFLGASLEACVIGQRKDVNKAFYGEERSASRLLAGDVPRPRGAEPLYKALDSILYEGHVPFDITDKRIREYDVIETALSGDVSAETAKDIPGKSQLNGPGNVADQYSFGDDNDSEGGVVM